jgi:FAD/FMN-containing dehydrogenase
MMCSVNLYQALTAAVGRDAVFSDHDVVASYERDWSGRFGGRAEIVVAPADTAQVAEAVRVCRRYHRPIVPQGGNTGLVGAGVPRDREVVLSTRRLNLLGEIDSAQAQVTVGAGVTLGTLQHAARGAGLDSALDIAARDSCTIGGLVACDAGGARALRYGTARARVAGLEAVLADGSVISRLTGLPKDNAGYNLPALLIGSEGTLGIITRVRWKLEPRLSARTATLVPLHSANEAAELLAALRVCAPSLESCEFLLDESLQLVLDHQRRGSPLSERAPIYVLAECAARSDPTDELVDALQQAGIEDALIADDTASRQRLWSLREGLADAINAAGVPHKVDVGIPLWELSRFIEEVPSRVAAAGGGRTILFGHLGDGNVHVNVLGPKPEDTRVEDALLELVIDRGGTISAEHGVGVAKARWLERALGPEAISAMRAIKGALDPECFLNPGAVLSVESTAARSAPGRA